MDKKVKLLLLLSSLVFVSFSCSCLFGKVTNTASNNEPMTDEVINTKNSVKNSAPTPAKDATAVPAATPAPAIKAEKAEPTRAVISEPTAVKTKTVKTVKTIKKSATPAVKAPSDKVADLLAKIKASQAETAATQTKIKITTYAEGGAPQVIKGDAIIRKKDKFRVHYTEPNEQIMISNGKTIWVYTPALNQAIKQSVEAANMNAQFYTDFSSSLNHYVKYSDVTLTEDETSYTLNMDPVNKKELDYDSIVVKVGKKDLMPFYMSLKVQGTVSEIEFIDTVNYKTKDLEGNADLSAKNFEFKAPEGVEVIDSAELMQGVTK